MFLDQIIFHWVRISLNLISIEVLISKYTYVYVVIEMIDRFD